MGVVGLLSAAPFLGSITSISNFMQSILAKPHSDMKFTNTSQWRIWYATNAGTSVTALGTVAMTSGTTTQVSSTFTAALVLTDANYMDGNIIRPGDVISVSGASIGANDVPVLQVNTGVSIIVQLPNAFYGASVGAGTITLRNKVRKALFAGCSRTGTANATTAVTFGPAYGALALPFSVPSGSAVVSTTVEEPQGSSFYLSDWNYKLGTAGDSLFVVYK